MQSSDSEIPEDPAGDVADIVASLRGLLTRLDEHGLVEAGIAVNEALIALGAEGVVPEEIRTWQEGGSGIAAAGRSVS